MLKEKRLAEKYGFPVERMLLQPNAVDVSYFEISQSLEDARRQLGLPINKRIALYTGHLFSWKGVYALADAAAYVPDNTAVYFVGGTVDDRFALQQYVRSRRIPNIEFLPHQEHAKIPVFLRAADVLILPNTAKENASKYETSPVKLFEYLAAHKPIVASDIPSIREIVSEREVFFFEPDNERSLAQTIATALTSTDAVLKKSHAARELAKVHSWEARSANIGNFIRSLL
jgi:glycosyltransferase involved in cell wall biosynthesis